MSFFLFSNMFPSIYELNVPRNILLLKKMRKFNFLQFWIDFSIWFVNRKQKKSLNRVLFYRWLPFTSPSLKMKYEILKSSSCGRLILFQSQFFLLYIIFYTRVQTTPLACQNIIFHSSHRSHGLRLYSDRSKSTIKPIFFLKALSPLLSTSQCILFLTFFWRFKIFGFVHFLLNVHFN